MVTVISFGGILTAVTAVLIAAIGLPRLIRARPVTQDFICRGSLLAIAIIPVLLFGRQTLVGWHWSVKVLPAVTTELAASTQPVVPVTRSSRSPVVSDDEAGSRVSATSSVAAQPFGDQSGSPSFAKKPVSSRAESTESVAPSLPLSPSKPTTVSGLGDINRPSMIWLCGLGWLIGAAIQFGRIGLAFWNTGRLSHTAIAADSPELCELNEWCANQVGLLRPARLKSSHQVNSPVVTGLFRATIVVPPALLQPQYGEDLRAALLHECGHARRHDVAFDLLLKIVMAIYWLHPLVYWLASDVRRLREEMCDNFVLKQESAVTYADILLRLAIDQRLTGFLQVGLGMFARRNRLESRVEGLLAANRSLDTAPTRSTRWSLLCMSGLVSLSSLLVRFDRVSAAPPEKAQKVEMPAKPIADNPKTSVESKDSLNEGAGETFRGDLPMKPRSEEFKEKSVAMAGPGIDDVTARSDKTNSSPPAREFNVKIENTKGDPVEGATVIPYGWNGNGNGFGMDANATTTTVSDAEGQVAIRFTKQLDTLVTSALGNPGVKGMYTLSLRIKHPDYPDWSGQYNLFTKANIVLPDPTMVIIRVHRDGESQPARRVAPFLSFGSSLDWSEVDGVVTCRKLNLADDESVRSKSRWLRVVQIPENGPCWFSSPIDLQHVAGDPIEIEATLKPSVRVEGRLVDDVPRPVVKGTIIALAVPTTGEKEGPGWSLRSEIAEDGTFVFESVPANSNLELVALCDGWVSHSLTETEFLVYQAEHRFPFCPYQRVAAGGVTPQLFRVADSLTQLVVAMDQVGTVEVTSIDGEGKPVPNVLVQFSAYHSVWNWNGGSSNLGAMTDLTQSLRVRIDTGEYEKPVDHGNIPTAWSRATDANGVAVITNLPPGSSGPDAINQIMFFATNQNYIAIPNNPLDQKIIGEPWLMAKLNSGKTTKTVIRMKERPKVNSESDTAVELDSPEDRTYFPGTSPDSDDNPETTKARPAGILAKGKPALQGIVVDPDGRPIEGAEILICDELNIRSDDKGRFRYEFDESPFDGEEIPMLPLKLVKEGYATQVLNCRFDRSVQTVTMTNDTFIEGAVKNPDGTPANGVSVRGHLEVRESYYSNYVSTETKSDANGFYKLPVQTGLYMISAGNSSAAMAWLPAPKNQPQTQEELQKTEDRFSLPQLIVSPGERKKLDIQLKAGVDFNARFVERLTGVPIPNVELYAHHHSVRGIEGAKSDQTGAVSIQELPAGVITLSIQASEYVRVWSDDAAPAWKSAVADIDGTPSRMTDIHDGVTFNLVPGISSVTIELERGVPVNGVVMTPEGQPYTGATISAVIGGSTKTSIYNRERFQTSSGKDGKFQLLLPPNDGRDIHLAVSDGRSNDHQKKWANGVSPALTLIPNQPVNDIELKLTRPGMIRGRVVNQQGQPVASVEVQSSSADVPESATANPRTTSDRTGVFTLRFVRPGRLRVHGKRPSGSSTANDESHAVEVQSGKVTDIGDVVIPYE